MTLAEAAKLAQDREQYDSMPITLVTASGKRVPAQWEDAYMGIIRIGSNIVYEDTLEQLGVTVDVSVDL